jgi:predicted nucleic acid-binding protein
MADYLLDTNHAAALVTLTHPLRARVLSRLQSAFRQGWASAFPWLPKHCTESAYSRAPHKTSPRWARLRPRFACHIPDEEDAENAAALQRSLRRQGWQLETVDAFIAVAALRYNLVLLTSDNDFAPVPGLRIENWTKP